MYVYCTWISMSVTVNPSFSRLSLTLRRNLPNRPVCPSSSSSLCSSSSSSSFTLLLFSLCCGQYSSHFWSKRHRHTTFSTSLDSGRGRQEGERGGVVSPHLVVLLESGNHDDDAAPLLPHHVPEVPHSVQHRPLGGDVGPGSSFVTLKHREEVQEITSQQPTNQSIKVYVYSTFHTGYCCSKCFMADWQADNNRIEQKSAS